MSEGPREEDKLNFKLQKQQALAFTCPANEILYGGAAGGGKSHLMRVDAIWSCLAVAGLQAFIFRRNYGDLYLNHLKGPTSFPELLGPLIRKKRVAIIGNEIRFANGSKIHLCHLQYNKSLQKYQGAEIHWLGIDELTHFEGSQYRYLRGRVRLGGLKVPDHLKSRFPRIISGTNPGGIGHNWVKDTFVRLGEMRVVKMPKKEGSMRRVFIPAKLSDNPALMENDPDYEDRLEALGDEVLVRAMKEGDWDVVAGAMFGAAWRKTRHVCKPFPIPIDWDIWRGADDGFGAPAALYWLTQDPQTKTVYVIDEIYKAGMLPDEIAEQVKKIDELTPRDKDGEIEPNGKPLNGYLDSAAFSNNGQSKTPRGKQITDAGVKFKPVPKWNGSRVHRVQDFHRRLKDNPLEEPDENGRRKPAIVFFSNCKHAIRTIPTLGRSETNVEDVDTHGVDHAFDGVTYGLQWTKSKVKRKRAKGY